MTAGAVRLSLLSTNSKSHDLIFYTATPPQGSGDKRSGQPQPERVLAGVLTAQLSGVYHNSVIAFIGIYDMKDKLESIGKVGRIHLGGLIVEVRVIDYKSAWGRDRWLVEPTSGSGQVWIESISFNLEG